MAHPVAETFRKAARLFQDDPRREGNVLALEPDDHLIVCGDLHGYRQNLVKVLAHARLPADAHRMLVLQEVIHGGPTDEAGGDRSFELLMRIARLKTQHPGQVHMLLANHDIAQVTGNEIAKEGLGQCKAFRQGLEHAFTSDTDEVYQAICELLLALPLAGRCPNGAFLSHSLPSPGREDLVDLSVLHRPYEDDDLRRGGSVYELVWGRRQDEPLLTALAERLEATWFINGHQPQDDGYAIVADRQIILACDHARGAIFEFDADSPLDLADAGQHIRPIARL